MSSVEVGPGSMLDVINTAIKRGAKAGDVLTVENGDGAVQKVTLGHTTPTLGGRLMLVAIVTEES